jgi:hypothetical protein
MSVDPLPRWQPQGTQRDRALAYPLSYQNENRRVEVHRKETCDPAETSGDLRMAARPYSGWAGRASSMLRLSRRMTWWRALATVEETRDDVSPGLGGLPRMGPRFSGSTVEMIWVAAARRMRLLVGDGRVTLR